MADETQWIWDAMFHETHDFVQKASGEAFWRLKLSFAQLRVSRGILGTYHFSFYNICSFDFSSIKYRKIDSLYICTNLPSFCKDNIFRRAWSWKAQISSFWFFLFSYLQGFEKSELFMDNWHSTCVLWWSTNKKLSQMTRSQVPTSSSGHFLG